MSATQVILLERVEKLGNLGDVVSVKPGYARNYLLPQKKALRASKENIAYFDAQKKALQAENDKQKKEAEKTAKKLEGLKAPLIRQASEAGQLYGSVNSRDIAAVISDESKETVTRGMVDLNQNIKTLGLFAIDVILHPEVRVSVTINVARSLDEAKTQAETGRALIADDLAAAQEEAADAAREEAEAQETDANASDEEAAA